MSNNEPIATYPYNLLEKAGIIDKDCGPLNDDQLKGLEAALNSLKEREKKAIELYFKEGKTLEGVGLELHITRARIQQMIAKAMRKLRHPSRSYPIRYGTDIREMNKHLCELRALKKEIEEYEAFVEENKEIAEKIGAIKAEKKRREEAITNLDISVRTYNSLHRGKLDLIDDIIPLVENGKIMELRNFGIGSYHDLVNALKKAGYKVKELEGK